MSINGECDITVGKNRNLKSNKKCKMATLDDSPTPFSGQPWAQWADEVDEKEIEEPPPVDNGKEKKGDDSSMKLRKKDMTLYGICPARDDFYLVVCEYCGQVVKPQALQIHIEEKHKAMYESGVKSGYTDGLKQKENDSRHTSDRGPRSHQSKSSKASRSKNSHKSTHKLNKNHAVPVVKVERMHPSLVNKKTSEASPNSSGSPLSIPEVLEQKVLDHKMSDLRASDHRSDTKSSDLTKPPDPSKMGHRPAGYSHSDHKLENKSHDHKSSGHRSSEHKSDHRSSNHKSSEHKSSRLPSDHRQSSEHRHSDKHSDRRSAIEHKSSSDRRQTSDRKPNIEEKSSHRSSTQHRGGSVFNTPTEEYPPVLTPTSTSVALSSMLTQDTTATLAAAVPPVAKVAGVVVAATTSSVVTSMSRTTYTLTSSSNTTTTTSTMPISGHIKSSQKKPPPLVEKKKMLPCKDRDYDPNVHCGCWVPDQKRHCTRSLTCKTHALSLRRAVENRRSSFDVLLQEHRDAKEAALKAKAEAAAGAPAKAASSVNKVACRISGEVTMPVLSRVKTIIPQDKPAVSSTTIKMPIMMAPVQVAAKSKQTRFLYTPSRPLTIPIIPKEEPPVPETCSKLSSDGDDDSDDTKERSDYPHLSYHPRPAAINNFGGRLHGTGCFVFSRKTDLLRAAFQATIERHLNPPPHKKLCVESKLPQGSIISTNSKDPYEFPTLGQLDSSFHGHHAALLQQQQQGTSNGSAVWHATKLQNQIEKAKTKQTGKVLKQQDGSFSNHNQLENGLKNQVISPSAGSAKMVHTPGGSSSSGGMKRKRSSGSSQSPAPGMITVNTNTNCPISIAIPTGSISLNLNQLGTNINQLTTANKTMLQQTTSNKNNVMKDLNIVVANMESAVNGQLVTIPASNFQDMRQLQLNNIMTSERQGKVKSQKSRDFSSTLGAVINPNADGAGPLGILTQTPGNLNLLSGIGSIGTSLEPSSTTMPSPMFQRSSTSPQISTPSSMPNGVVTSPTGIGGFKNYHNHHGATTMSPSSRNSTPSPSLTGSSTDQSHISNFTQFTKPSDKNQSLSRHHSSSRSHNIHGSGSKHLQGTTHQNIAAAAISLSAQGNRFIPNNLFQGQVVGATPGGIGHHIQIQPKQGGGKTITHGKMQPVSLAIMTPSAIGIHPQQTLLLQGEEHRKHDLSQQVHSNSPSNVLS